MKQLPEIRIGQVLSYFMKKFDMNDHALATQTGVPLPTIARLRRGKDVNPTATTLRPLADFFHISVGQLLGDEPIDYSSPSKISNLQIPIIKWEDIGHCLNQEPNRGNYQEFIFTQQNVSRKSFALIMNASTQNSLFQRGTLLIIDPSISPLDGDFALVSEAGTAHPAIKQLLLDGKDLYSKSINPEIRSIHLLSSEDKVIGIVVEARHSFKNTNK